MARRADLHRAAAATSPRAEAKPESERPSRPERTCVGCARTDDPTELIRVVLGPMEGPTGDVTLAEASPPTAKFASVAFDLAGRAFGRGAHVHASPECLRKACRGGFARSFRAEVRVTQGELEEQLTVAVRRRVEGLVSGAIRAKKAALGAQLAGECLKKEVAWLVVASDAGGAVAREPFASAVAAGRAAVCGDKHWLGRLAGREELAVVAVVATLGEAIVKTARLADAVRRS
jgi:predicted RNA-binding protein YlxR (DUF448 family)